MRVNKKRALFSPKSRYENDMQMSIKPKTDIQQLSETINQEDSCFFEREEFQIYLT